ncbi:hypothetical protein K2Q16_01145 [Patescibacteria group bacterium]|nr:hypothetical protein [Patescibacteria group bacterium]
MRIVVLLVILAFVGNIYSCISDAGQEERHQVLANTTFQLETPAEHITVRGCIASGTPNVVTIRNTSVTLTARFVGLLPGRRGGDEQHWFRMLAPETTIQVPESMYKIGGRVRIEDETGKLIGLFHLGCSSRSETRP